MEDTKELITTDDIRSKVYIIRGQQVMLDKDLAEIDAYNCPWEKFCGQFFVSFL